MENCYAFKCKVQDLLDSHQINFTPNPNVPNVVQNPMPPHGGGAAVNALFSDGDTVLNVVRDVDLLSTPLPLIKKHLISNGIFPGCGPDCGKCQRHPNGCDGLRNGI